ncbi:synaptotagmin-A-like [Chelonia mydas]|uniref:synaptotagmin-A-like n=1 Tax=Chelonia mydas TaxID=8469 RepID=UPI001CAA39FA|nr:synaptotagmin-A-like [Chelonia mydas]
MLSNNGYMIYNNNTISNTGINSAYKCRTCFSSTGCQSLIVLEVLQTACTRAHRGTLRSCFPAACVKTGEMTQEDSILLHLQSLQLPFPDTWKYGILALAILLVLVALTILACQMRYCQKLRKLGRKKKYLSEACKDTKAENGILGNELRPALLDIVKQSLPDVKIQKLQEELNKLGTCLFPSCTCSKNLESVGSNPEFLESSRGRLRFSLFYHREQLELLLTVIAVTGLPSRGSADSAVRVRLLRQVPSHISGLQCMVHEWQTQVVKNCRKPAFGDQFVCSLQEAELEKSTVKLEVKHFNKYSRHTVLGEVRLTLSKLKASQPMEFCEVLQKTTKDLVGEVLVSLKCLPISQKIEIGLLKVKTASVCSSPEKNVYARIDISCNLHKQKHQKSSPRARTSVIIFNETFLFHLAEPVAGAYTVLVSIYEMSSRARGRSRQLIGQAVLGKRSPSEANDHWALMMQSVQQPVAKWHPLLL